MQYISIDLRIVIIITVYSIIAFGITNYENPDKVEQTIEIIKEYMSRSPTPWPEEWKREYVKTIHSIIDSYKDVTHFDLRLQILRKCFAPYWESFNKISERYFFELHCARIRWYTEHLMESEFPTDAERQKLRNQYNDIWNCAADSLLKQFPFLDPNTVEQAKADDLNLCYRKIEAPLMPVYLKPMSEEQVAQIKQSWNNLRYIRIDLWRRLNDSSKTPVENLDAPSSNAKYDYQLIKESLSQLLELVWTIVPQRPDYYLSAIKNRDNELKRCFQSKSMARSDQQLLEKECSRQLLQIEHISFILAALLETMSYNDGLDSIRPLEKSLLEQQGRSAKGGGAYEVGTFSTEK